MKHSELMNEKTALHEQIAVLKAQLVESTHQRQSVERVLAGGYDRFRVLFETMSLGVVYQDVLGGITTANPAAEQILGLSLDQMQGRKPIDPRWHAIHEDGTDFPGEQQPANLALLTAKPVLGTVMGVYHHQNEACNWILVDAIPEFQAAETRPYQVCITFMDITARKQADAAQQASEARFLTAFESSPLAVSIARVSDAVFIQINSAFTDLLGYTREQILDHTALELGFWASPEDRVGFVQIFKDEGHVRNFEALLHQKSGGEIPARLSAELIEIDGVACMLVQIVDITKRKLAERNLLQRTEDLQLIKTLNDAANRGEDMDGIAQIFADETRSMFNCQDINIYLISPDEQHIELQSTTTSRKLLARIEKLIGRSIPKIRIPLTESSFFTQILSVEKGTLVTDKKLLERWMSEFADTTYLHESLRSISQKIIPRVLKILHTRSVILIPLISSGQTIGLMGMTSKELLTDEIHQRLRSISNQVTEVLLHKQSEKKVQVQLQRLSALSEIDRAISSSMDMRLSLDTLLTHSLSQLNVDAASVLLFNAPSQMLEYAAGKGFRSLNIRQVRMQIGQGLAGRVGLERKTLHIPDLSAKGGQLKYKNFFKEENFVQYFGVPLIAKGTLKGVLEIFNRSLLDPDQAWLNYLETLGGQAAIAIDNVQMFGDLQQSNQELVSQNAEKEKRAAELVIANQELAYQNAEKEKRAAELLIANQELAYQNAEKEKRAAELLIANQELAYQNAEKEKRAAELVIVNQDLMAAYDATIAGWSHAMDLRDKETEGHTQRVTNLTMRLAERMGINQREIVQVRRGALLHDIGKLGIPDSILLKPGKLTEEEWVIMRQHTNFAYNMLMPIAYLRPAMDIPYCHHEKWDGTGYPRGLKAESIPLVARIFSIIDVWDALRSDRPYRASWPVKKVREYVAERSGTHFDPQVVEAFFSFLDASSDMQ